MNGPPSEASFVRPLSTVNCTMVARPSVKPVMLNWAEMLCPTTCARAWSVVRFAAAARGRTIAAAPPVDRIARGRRNSVENIVESCLVLNLKGLRAEEAGVAGAAKYSPGARCNKPQGATIYTKQGAFVKCSDGSRSQTPEHGDRRAVCAVLLLGVAQHPSPWREAPSVLHRSSYNSIRVRRHSEAQPYVKRTMLVERRNGRRVEQHPTVGKKTRGLASPSPHGDPPTARPAYPTQRVAIAYVFYD